jgi:hypothetical protein
MDDRFLPQAQLERATEMPWVDAIEPAIGYWMACLPRQ